MEDSVAAQTLFELFAQRIDDSTEALRNGVFSEYRDIPWTSEQRKVLQPLIRAELERLAYNLLKVFDNVGGVIPEVPDVTNACNVQNIIIYYVGEHEDMEYVTDDPDIRTLPMDYADMWMRFLKDKAAAETK